MLFNSYFFIFVFLPLVMLLWWRVKQVSLRLAFIVGASYLFYAWWDYRFVSLLAFSTLVDYLAGKRLAAAEAPSKRTWWLVVSLLSNLGLLAFFKYSGFMTSSCNSVFDWLRLGGRLPVMDIVLPVGISFYTFQTLSYTIDIYRRKAQPAESILHFAAYVSLFPQLIAGPIVRYTDIEDQLREISPDLDWQKFSRGIFFFVCGLAQKVILADAIAAKIDPLFADHTTLQFFGAWFCMVGYACQLYFDFSGYSNMAVGLGLMLGFQFPQNFDSPYKSENIAAFWRRWHITLSFWLRDYLFIPLGGSRVSQLLTLRNLVIVMFLGGLWHGAGWTFVLWGLYHGMLLVGHSLASQHLPVKLPKLASIVVTFLAVVFGWVLFRSTDMAMCGGLYQSMLGGNGIETNIVTACGGTTSLGILTGLLAIVFLLPNLWQIKFRATLPFAILLSTLVVVCVLRFDSESPFLYFQF